MDEKPTLTDERITELIDDPTLIDSHEIVLEVLAVLDAEIASIQSQVDAAQIEANARPLSEERQSWLRRACYAGAMRKQVRHRVMMRDKELRGTKGPAQTLGKKGSPEERLLKQKRLLLEAEARKENRTMEHERQRSQWRVKTEALVEIVRWWDGLPPSLRQDIEGSGEEPGCIARARRLRNSQP